MSFFIDENKKLRRLASEPVSEPKVLSLSLEIGNYKASPTVEKGQRVLKWQKIADGDIAFHSPVTGVVEDVSENYIVIKNEFSSDSCELTPTQKNIRELSGEEISAVAKDAGIWCRHSEKPLSDAINDCIGKAGKMIISLCENQPPVSSLYRLAIENTDEIIGGAKILMKACGVRRAVIAVDSDKRVLIRTLREKCASSPLFTIKPVKNGYPSEKPRHLIYNVFSLETDTSKGLAECGYAVFDGRACFDMYNALLKGLPPVTCTVTVSGDCIATPKNLTVPLGTSVSEIMSCCGGTAKKPHKIINGGVFDGVALWDGDLPVNKDTVAVSVLSEDYYRKKETACIRCGRCAKICPAFLFPVKIVAAYEKGKTDKCEKYGIESCTGCGLCSYVCPANIPVAHKMSQALTQLRGEKNGK